MAAVTKSLSFGITSSTTYEHPFSLARRFSTLDHLTKGRVAWNIVTSYLENAARNFGLDTQIPHDTRYAKAEEYVNVTYKLWEGSWRDDAVVQDHKTRQYTVPGRVRRINHEGLADSLMNNQFSANLVQRVVQISWASSDRTFTSEDTFHFPGWD